MGITLIVAGVILTIVGVVMVSRGSGDAGNSIGKSDVSVSEINTKRQVLDNSVRTCSGKDSAVKNQDISKPSKSTDISSNPSEGSHQVEDMSDLTTATNYEKEHKLEGQAMTSKEKGDEFEDFTINLLADWRMKLLRRTQDKMSSGGVVAESCKEPDLHIEQKRGNSKVDYHLECKYRSIWTNEAVTFDDWQIKRYREFQKAQKRKVLIALGVGGTPGKPQTFMIVPIDSIKGNTIRKVDVSKYAVSPTSDGLAEYIDHYFDEVFASARRKHRN